MKSNFWSIWLCYIPNLFRAKGNHLITANCPLYYCFGTVSYHYKKPMKLCISLRDQDFDHTKSIGIFNVSIGLTYALVNNANIEKLIVLANRSLADQLGALKDHPNVEVIGINEPTPRGLSRILWDQWGIRHAVKKHKVDWLILPKGFVPLLLRFDTKVCTYIHDNIFKFYADMGWNKSALFEKYYFKWSYKKSVQCADLVVTNSQFTMDQVLSSGRKLPTSRVGIGFEPIDKSVIITEARSGLLIFISAHPHKLSEQAIQWLSRWKLETGNPIKIFCVGRMPVEIECSEGQGWEVMSRLSQSEMNSLWGKVKIMVYFSAYEGFGMPPCEAVRNGVIPVVSDIPPHRENIPAEFLFSNKHYESFASCLNHALETNQPPFVELDDWDAVGNLVVTELLANSE